MAKTTPAKSAGTSRVRFVMMEAEIADGGELAQFTQAIQNALRGPAPVTIKRISSASALNEPANNQAEPETLQEVVEEEAEVVEENAHPKKVRASRKVGPKPNVIDIDVASNPPLSSLVDPKTNHGRYLAIAAWLHDHRDIQVITADHIYTCYRHLNWPTDIANFTQPFHELKFNRYFTSPERGKFAINQLGLAKAAESIA